MSDTPWTKGPWRIARGNMGNLIEAPTGAEPRDEWDDGYAAVATVQACTSDRTLSALDANAIANLHLVTAAPDMAEALDDLLMAIDLPGDHCELEPAKQRARAALAKARGEPLPPPFGGGE